MNWTQNINYDYDYLAIKPFWRWPTKRRKEHRKKCAFINHTNLLHCARNISANLLAKKYTQLTAHTHMLCVHNTLLINVYHMTTRTAQTFSFSVLFCAGCCSFFSLLFFGQCEMWKGHRAPHKANNNKLTPKSRCASILVVWVCAWLDCRRTRIFCERMFLLALALQYSVVSFSDDFEQWYHFDGFCERSTQIFTQTAELLTNTLSRYSCLLCICLYFIQPIQRRIRIL